MTACGLWAAARQVGAPGARRSRASLHLPLATARTRPRCAARQRRGRAELELRTICQSPLSAGELAELRASYRPDLSVRASAPTCGSATAARSGSPRPCSMHEVERGDLRLPAPHRAQGRAHILVVSGGTAHGIGLEAPTGDASLRARAATLARGGLTRPGSRSPFSIDGKRLFAEPPTCRPRCSSSPRRAGAGGRRQVDVRVRYTTTAFDRIVIDAEHRASATARPDDRVDHRGLALPGRGRGCAPPRHQPELGRDQDRRGPTTGATSAAGGQNRRGTTGPREVMHLACR